MALTRRACLFSELAMWRRGLVAAALAFISVTAPLSARSGEPQPIDSSRIISIGGAVTETIYALGLEGRIVGVNTTSLYPPEALKRAPNVGVAYGDPNSVQRSDLLSELFAVDLAVGTTLASEKPLVMPSRWLYED
jgi:ABC-type Fe3+-hydroxamate transport system substrate-binding protein